MQNVDYKYAPGSIQIEIGNTQDNYHYKSQIFPIDQESIEE